MKVIHGKTLSFQPASHEDPQNPGVFKKILCTRDDIIFGKIQMINWAKLPKGKSFQNHYHEDMEEIFIIIAGVVEAVVNEQIFRLDAGDTLIVSPTERHMMKNISDIDVGYIVLGVTTDQNGKTVRV